VLVSNPVTTTSKAIINVPQMTLLNNRNTVMCIPKTIHKHHVRHVTRYILLHYVLKNISTALVHSECQNKFRQATLCHYLNSGYFFVL